MAAATSSGSSSLVKVVPPDARALPIWFTAMRLMEQPVDRSSALDTAAHLMSIFIDSSLFHGFPPAWVLIEDNLSRPPFKTRDSCRGVKKRERSVTRWAAKKESTKALREKMAHAQFVLPAGGLEPAHVTAGGNAPELFRFFGRREVSLAVVGRQDFVVHAVDNQQRPGADARNHVGRAYPVYIDSSTQPHNRHGQRRERK